jgi:hypothetical protein
VLLVPNQNARRKHNIHHQPWCNSQLNFPARPCFFFFFRNGRQGHARAQVVSPGPEHRHGFPSFPRHGTHYATKKRLGERSWAWDGIPSSFSCSQTIYESGSSSHLPRLCSTEECWAGEMDVALLLPRSAWSAMTQRRVLRPAALEPDNPSLGTAMFRKKSWQGDERL